MRARPPIIQTARLRLREFLPDDVDALTTVLSDSETMRFYPARLDRVRVAEWIERNWRRYATDGFGLGAMILTSTNELIGDCGLIRQVVDGTEEVKIGYHVRRDLWRNGLAIEAARACSDYGFARLPAGRLISLMRPENWFSRRVAEKNEMGVCKEILWHALPHLVYAVQRPRERS
jgi:[ribosomal protein S5]-alanine N-acetyltransferase